MVTKKSTIAIILFAIFTSSDLARIRLDKVEGKKKFVTRLHIAAQNDAKDTIKTVVEDRLDNAFEDEATLAADIAKTHSTVARVTVLELPAALVQEAAAQGEATHIPTQNPPTAFQKVVEAGRQLLVFLLDNVRKRLGVVPNDTPSSVSKTPDHVERAPNSFTKTLDYIKRAPDYQSRLTILEVACETWAFSCEEIAQLADNCQRPLSLSSWKEGRVVFAQGRNGAGCISDPDNAMSIIDTDKAMSIVVSHDPGAYDAFIHLDEAFIDLKPAKDVGPPPMQLQTGLRTDEDMETLLRNMAELQLIKDFGSQPPGSRVWEPGSPSVEEFESWLKQIKADGEQFSGPQLVTLVSTIPKNSGQYHSQVVAALRLLQHLGQYVTGVTCEEVKQILRQIGLYRRGFSGIGPKQMFIQAWLGGLVALQSNIIDGQNKVDIVAFTGEMLKVEASVILPGGAEISISQAAARALKDLGVGLPPKNNPIFGVLRGNPVILVVDESTPMDMNFTLGNDTFTRRNFCHNQLEIALEGLPNGTYFNVIQYSSSAVKIFPKPVLLSKTNIDATMEAMGSSWRGNHPPGQDPSEMLRNIKVFALNFKHLRRSAKRNSMEALQLAYATADLPSKQTDDGQRTLHDGGALVATKHLPQIYFLTSGQPDGGAKQILEHIGEFDNDRNIPVNSIAFIMPADPVAKQFAKDLANMTGGFFRSIEQPS